MGEEGTDQRRWSEGRRGWRGWRGGFNIKLEKRKKRKKRTMALLGGSRTTRPVLVAASVT